MKRYRFTLKVLKFKHRSIFEDLENILKKLFLEIENKFKISVNNVNLMIEYQKLKSINITIKENFENKILSKQVSNIYYRI